MSKHTPGPWNIAERTCKYGVTDKNLIAILNANKLNATFEAMAIEDKRKDRTIALIPLDDSNLENARLISAAPELLESLKGLRFNNCFCEMRIGNPMVTRHSDCCVSANAAIAKAEGK